MAGSPLRQLSVLIRYLRGERPSVLLLALLVPLGVGLQLVAPQMLRRFIDHTLTGSPADLLLAVAAWYLTAALGLLVVTVAGDAVAARLAWRGTNRLRADLVAHCLRRPSRFYQRHPPGELLDRVDGDVTRLTAVMSALVLEVLAQLLLVAGILGALFLLDWRLALVFAPFAAGTLLLLRGLVGRAMPFVAARQASSADLLGFLEERLAGAQDLRTNGAAAHTLADLEARQDELYRRAHRAARVSVRWPATVQSLSTVSVVLALGVSVWLHDRGQLSTGTAFACLSYAMLLRRPLLAVTTRFHDLEEAAVSVRRLTELLRRDEDEEGDGADGVEGAERKTAAPRTGRLPDGPLGARLDGVFFGYDPGEPVLRDVSFRLRPGERLGIVGRTGSGKSTVVRLLFGLQHPARGTVSVGDQDVAGLDPRALRRRVALVTQEVQILHATLRDNLTFYDPSVDDGRVRAALDEAGLTEWWRELPDGLDTVLGTGARGMSAGQEQLLALARVFLRDPAVVLMDEPTARLDPHTERLLMPAMGRLLEGRTAVVVQHRPHALRNVHRVLVLDGGAVVEHGEQTTLAADPTSRFHELLRTG
ncbi:ABC transporter ATP-binding protein [Streptomyces lincolnensis]|uniref:ABC transporter ATP-binding protein n=1 Tax=Streptomyces lincolnensis TaxID=1915 RepID=A0A1B1MIZ0_STRLN|nr:ABC transporter ATP-binding protein [Streptomyces lincolnensis]ANS68568.1 ABC transporter ATP-binding protein [Streptomyces lincolnensis]QMV10189.1 ATP-binding cassette domain-containing protein [Streptomyces lincolnensis]